jgi:hypothetical protein
LLAGRELDYESDEIYCQLWFEEKSQPVVEKATEFFMIWNEFMGHWTSDTLLPYLIKCPISHETPKTVSLTPKPCANPSNMLKVIDNKPQGGVKKNFIVTVKALHFEDRDFVIRFIEWVEIMKILGADKIDVFYRSIHPDLLTILHFYQQQGFIDFQKFLEPKEINTTSYNNLQMMMIQMMQHTDCFYRNRNLYKYFVVLDVDEVIIPMRPEDRTWNDLVNKRYRISSGSNSFMSYNSIFSTDSIDLPGIPQHLYMLTHFKVRIKLESNSSITHSFNFSEQKL